MEAGKEAFDLRIEKLTDDKIKITLSSDDLKSRNIDIYSFMYNSPESQDLFWDMIQEAEIKYGFCIDESMVYVEASTSGSDAFTLIVTKTNSGISSPMPKNKLKKGAFKLKRKPISLELKANLYLFDSFEDICSFCNIVDLKKIGENSLYKLDSSYYLKSNSMPFNNILEFATIVKSPELILAKINEYGESVLETNALQSVKKIFLNNRRKSNN